MGVIKWSESSLWGSWNRIKINAVIRQKRLWEIRIGVLKKVVNNILMISHGLA